MFGVGLHFSVGDLLAVRRVVLPGAIGQIVLATGLGLGLALAWGWSVGVGVVLGLSLSVASTVVLLKALEERNVLTTVNGRLAIGWLIVEDLAMVLVLVLLPAFADALGGHVGAAAHAPDRQGFLMSLGLTLAKVAAFVAVALLLGPRVLLPRRGWGDGRGACVAVAGTTLRSAAGRTLGRRARRLGGGTCPGRAQSRRPQDRHPAGACRALSALRRLDARATRGAAAALQTADGGARGTDLPRGR